MSERPWSVLESRWNLLVWRQFQKKKSEIKPKRNRKTLREREEKEKKKGKERETYLSNQ